MYVIFDELQKIYYQRHDDIITFDCVEKAEWFVENFYQYALQRCMQANPFQIPLVMKSKEHTVIKPIDFDTSRVTTINFDELVN